MKRIVITVLLVIGLLASCTGKPSLPDSTSRDGTTTVDTTASSELTVPDVSSPTVTTDSTDQPKPVTTPMVTTPTVTTPAVTSPTGTTTPPETKPIPVFGDVNLDEVDRSVRTVVFTQEKTPLYNREGQKLAEIESGKALIMLVQTEDYAVILYRDTLYLTYPQLLTEQVPAQVQAIRDQLGGIYYPCGEVLVAIDAGHQGKAMKDKEPLGPGSDEMKAMVSSGTQGISTKIPERELNLQVSLLLRDELISRGYSVLMIRESHDVTISNVQRAKLANAYQADAFIRIHANGSTNQTARGGFTICQTPKNPYNGDLHAESRRLSDCILSEYCMETDIDQRNVWETDTMTGINWAQIPVTILEMGYMSNPEEDELMATDAFRQSAAVGIANGMDAFFTVE